jgi:hypothetical protein
MAAATDGAASLKWLSSAHAAEKHISPQCGWGVHEEKIKHIQTGHGVEVAQLQKDIG